MTYKDMKIDFIIDWCKANKQLDWLEAEMSKMVEVKRYPKTKVQARDKVTGELLFTKKGQPKMVSVADKSQAPTVELEPIGFIQIKQDFCEKFMPDVMPKAQPKKASMRDKLAAAVAK